MLALRVESWIPICASTFNEFKTMNDLFATSQVMQLLRNVTYAHGTMTFIKVNNILLLS